MTEYKLVKNKPRKYHFIARPGESFHIEPKPGYKLVVYEHEKTGLRYIYLAPTKNGLEE